VHAPGSEGNGERSRDWPARIRAAGERSTRPLRRMWSSDDPLEDYALVHMASAAGDVLVGLALADSVFFSLPTGQAKIRVALYLALTMAPLAVAAPFLVPLLDRGGFRRAISFASGAGRSHACIFAAPRVDSLLLFPIAFTVLVLSKAHSITKNGLTAAYAGEHQGLLAANAWLGRIGIAGVLLAIGPGLLLLQLGGPAPALYLAAATYAVSALLNLRLEVPPRREAGGDAEVSSRGRLPGLATAAAGTSAARAASGFLLFLMAFALRGADEPVYWLAVLIAAGMAGAFLGLLLAPRLPRTIREEAVVLGSLLAAGGGALVAFFVFSLPILGLAIGLSGMATEFSRLAFQSLMQRTAPIGAQGRVFVRYEVLFQLAWVAGALIPAMLPIPFRAGVLMVALFYLGLALSYLIRLQISRTKPIEP
jgi:hypothetical protein